jgi:non-heme chloroperoxidase
VSAKLIPIDTELSLYVEESGHGDVTLLMVPGWTMTTEVFRHQCDFFADSQDYRFVSFDPRAHGRSSKTAGGHFYEQHGRDLKALIDLLELKNIVLCGWSFGTLAILSYLNQFGAGLLSGLIMLDGPPRATGENNQTDWVTYCRDDRDRQQEFYTMGRLRDRDSTNREFVEWMLEDKSEDSIQWLLELTRQTPDSAAALLNATANFLDFRDDLIALDGRLPLLYLVRKDSGEIVTRWAAEFTPNATIAALGEHMMFWERPQQCNRLLNDFLKTCIPD